MTRSTRDGSSRPSQAPGSSPSSFAPSPTIKATTTLISYARCTSPSQPVGLTLSFYWIWMITTWSILELTASMTPTTMYWLWRGSMLVYRRSSTTGGRITGIGAFRSSIASCGIWWVDWVTCTVLASRITTSVLPTSTSRSKRTATSLEIMPIVRRDKPTPDQATSATIIDSAHLRLAISTRLICWREMFIP